MPRKTIKERLEAKSIPEPNSGCWIWLGPITKSARGDVHNRSKTSVGARTLTASRLAYEAFVGEIPDGLLVLHKCDTPLCINPGHLYVGTHLDNVRDMISRGRYVPRNKAAEIERHGKFAA